MKDKINNIERKLKEAERKINETLEVMTEIKKTADYIESIEEWQRRDDEYFEALRNEENNKKS